MDNLITSQPPLITLPLSATSIENIASRLPEVIHSVSGLRPHVTGRQQEQHGEQRKVGSEQLHVLEEYSQTLANPVDDDGHINEQPELPVAGPSHTLSSIHFPGMHMDFEGSFRLSTASIWARSRTPGYDSSSSDSDIQNTWRALDMGKGKARVIVPDTGDTIMSVLKRKQARRTGISEASEGYGRVPRRRGPVASHSDPDGELPGAQETLIVDSQRTVGGFVTQAGLGDNNRVEQEQRDEDDSGLESEEEVLRYLKRQRTRRPQTKLPPNIVPGCAGQI